MHCALLRSTFRKSVVPISDARGFNAGMVVLILLWGLSIAHASPSDYDNSFGNGGIASFPMPDVGNGVAHDLAQLSDGSLLLGGTVGLGPLLVRLTSTGRVDPTFGANGFDNTRHGDRFLQEGILVAAAPPNQFTIVEFHGNPLLCASPFFFRTCIFRDLVAWRINGGGAPDSGYAPGGFILIPKSEGSLAVSPAGALVALTMRPQDAGFPVFGVVALRADGQRDPAFEQRALDALNCGSQFALGSNPVGVSRWNAGKLVVAMGVAESQALGAPRTLCVSRLNDDGSLDTTFATNGHFVLQAASLADHFPFKILVRSDGRILIVMLDAPPGSIHTAAYVWLTPNGGLDTAFVSGGMTNPANLLVASVVDVTLQADDRILVTGYNRASPGAPGLPVDAAHPILARFEANGSGLDTTFDTAHLGFRTLTNSVGWLSPQKVLASSDGGIFVLGTLVGATPTPNDPVHSGDFAVAKLRDTPDSGGGGGGGGGGCAMVQAGPGGPVDPTLPLVLALGMAWARFQGPRKTRRSVLRAPPAKARLG